MLNMMPPVAETVWACNYLSSGEVAYRRIVTAGDYQGRDRLASLKRDNEEIKPLKTEQPKVG